MNVTDHQLSYLLNFQQYYPDYYQITTIEQQSLLRFLICEMIKIQMQRGMSIIDKQKGHENLPMLVHQGLGKDGTVG